MIAANDLTFVDSNVLIYAHDTSAGGKREVAAARLADLWRTRAGIISVQVLQELYVNITRKVARPLAKAAVIPLLEAYAKWRIVVPDAATVVQSVRVEERFQLSFWDALIVTSAQMAGAKRLLTEDLQGGQNFDGVVVENPFL